VNGVYVVSVALVAASLVAYQLAQRSVSAGSSAWSPLLVAYLVGASVCGAGLVLTSQAPIAELRKASIGSLVLGLAVVGIEYGYLQAHRAGWNPAAVGLVGSVGGTVALGIVAATFLHEPLTLRQLFGMVCCTFGLVLLLTHGS
jgi:drug/metabolite transporter (DMT)-like permease